MAGTTATLRVSGVQDSGFPAEIDATVKIRWVDDLLVNMSERSADLLKYLGGPAQFAFNNTKVEWVEDDVWNRRPTLGTTPLAAGSDTSLALAAGTAFRYPVGTILYNVTQNEHVRVLGAIDADTVAVTRDVYAQVTDAAWLATDEVIVAGYSMHENDAWVARPTSVFNLPFNYAQVSHQAVDVTYRRQETALYGLRGTDLDHQSAAVVAEQFVGVEDSVVHGFRFAGSSTIPAAYGGLKFFVTAANRAQVTALAGAPLTRKDIDDMAQALYYAVGADNMARTLLVSAWAKRKISSFFSAAERLGPGASEAGVAIDRFNTDFGPMDVMLQTSLGKNELYFIKRENFKIGNYGQRGRPHLEEAVATNASGQTGPFQRRVYYHDLSLLCKGVDSMGRISGFSLTS